MFKIYWLLAAFLSIPCLNISAQNSYCCTGYGGLFADSLGISTPEIREVATLPNAYGNTRVRVMIHRPVLQKPATCNLTKRPCLILVHGGFWAELGADNTWATFSNEAARNFVPAGFVTASVRYRTGIGGGNELSLALGQPCLMNPSSDIAQAAGKAAYDVQLATQYIFEKADELGIDTSQVYYFGSSAGAFNVINATYMAKGEQLLGTAMLARARVRGTIGLVGGVNNLSIFDATDPKVPLLLFHGTADEVAPFDCGMISQCPAGSSFQVPVCGSKAIYDRCQQLGIPVDMQIACGSNHGLTGLPLSYVICRSKKWLSERIAGKVAPNGITYATGMATTYAAQPCAPVTCQAPNGVCPPGATPQSGHFNLAETGNAAPLGFTSNLRPTADGNGYLVVGTRGSGENSRAVLARTDLNYNPLWTLRLDFSLSGNGNSDQATYGADVVDLGNDQYVLLAAANSFWLNGDIAQNLDYALIRFKRTAAGADVQWAKRYGGSFNDVPHALLRTKDGALLASGYSNMEQALNLPGQMRTFLVKTDLAGNQLWNKRFQDGNACRTSGYALIPGVNRRPVIEAADGGLLFATPCDERIYLTKTKANGEVLWNQSFNASNSIANGLNLGGLGAVGLAAGSAGAVVGLKELPNGDIALLGNQFVVLLGAIYAQQQLQATGTALPFGWLMTTNNQGVFKHGTAFFRQKSNNDPQQPIEMLCQDFGVLPNGNFLVATSLKGSAPSLLEIDPSKNTANTALVGGTMMADNLKDWNLVLSNNRGLSSLRLLYNPQNNQMDLAYNLRRLLRYRGGDWKQTSACTVPLDRTYTFPVKIDLSQAPPLAYESLPNSSIVAKMRPIITVKNTNCGTQAMNIATAEPYDEETEQKHLALLAGYPQTGHSPDLTYADPLDKQGTLTPHKPSQSVVSDAVLYPNPAQDRAMLRYKAPSDGNIRIALFDALGRLVSEQDYAASEGVNIAEIDLGGVPNGAYLLRVCSDGAVLVLRGERYE